MQVLRFLDLGLGDDQEAVDLGAGADAVEEGLGEAKRGEEGEQEQRCQRLPKFHIEIDNVVITRVHTHQELMAATHSSAFPLLSSITLSSSYMRN